MHMWASDEVCVGIFTLLCMLSPLIKRDHQEKEECKECNMRNGLGTDVCWPIGRQHDQDHYLIT